MECEFGGNWITEMNWLFTFYGFEKVTMFLSKHLRHNHNNTEAMSTHRIRWLNKHYCLSLSLFAFLLRSSSSSSRSVFFSFFFYRLRFVCRIIRELQILSSILIIQIYSWLPIVMFILFFSSFSSPLCVRVIVSARRIPRLVLINENALSNTYTCCVL